MTISQPRPGDLAARLRQHAADLADELADDGLNPFTADPEDVLADLRAAADLAGARAVPYVPVLAAAKFRIVQYQRIKLLRAEVELDRALEDMTPEGAAEFAARTAPILAETEAALAAIEGRANARRVKLAEAGQ
jgi:hypothetical protein